MALAQPNSTSVSPWLSFDIARLSALCGELFEDSGECHVDAGEMNGFTWYQSTRYDLDLPFVGRHQQLQVDQDGSRYDVDKTSIDTPVYVASRGPARSNPFAEVTDFTAIGAAIVGLPSVIQSAEAAGKSPIDPAVNSNHYGHIDFLSADDSCLARCRWAHPARV